MKPIMNIMAEKPLKGWMKWYVILCCPKSSIDTIIRQRKEDDVKEFNLSVRKTHRGYVLGEGKWESKKTLNDYLSYLNQYSTVENPINVVIWNDRPFGNCDFVLDMISFKRRFKRINFKAIMLKDDNNDWWSITNQLD